MTILGSRALPSRAIALGRELHAWRASLVTDIGGPDAVSTQQLALIEKAVTQKLICDSLDAYVLGMPSLVNKRHRTLWPIVRERTAQVTLLQSLLRDLGLDRKSRDVADLPAYLAQQAAERTESPQERRTDPAAGSPPRSGEAKAKDETP